MTPNITFMSDELKICMVVNKVYSYKNSTKNIISFEYIYELTSWLRNINRTKTQAHEWRV
jgi:hypothetical protein